MQFDSSVFRQALGLFTTGITVVTTISQEGKPAGLTVNSFSSVSLLPPLVLWCLDKRAAEFEAFKQASHYCIQVLSEEQQALSERFANSHHDKFAGLNFNRGLHQIPELQNCLAYFYCLPWQQYEGGDHIILVGEVESLCIYNKAAPLTYFGSRYCRLTHEQLP